MSLTKKVFKNISYLLLARTIYRVLTAVVMIWAARYLGVERFGMFETAMAWSNAFLALNDVGMSQLIVREAARDEKKAAVYFGNTLLVEVVLSILLFGVVIGIGYGLKYNDTTIILMAILGAAGLIFEFRKVMRSVLRVLFKLKMVALTEVANGFLYLLMAGLLFVVITDKDTGLLSFAWLWLISNSIFVIVLFIYTIRAVKPTFQVSAIWPMVKQSYVFTLYNMFFMLYFQIDQIILSIMQDQRAVGIYSAAAKLVTVFLFIPIMTFQVTTPLMYRYSQENPEKYQRINLALWRYLAAFGVPAGIGLSLLAAEIIDLVYGVEYAASVAVLQVMGLFLAIRFCGISQGNSLTTSDRQGLRATIQIISVGINIALDIYLIREYGAVGAAIATTITETVIIGCYLYFSSRYLGESILRNAVALVPVALATLVMAGLIFLAKPYLHVIVLVIFGAIVYTFALWLFRFFRSYDRQIFQQILRKS